MSVLTPLICDRCVFPSSSRWAFFMASIAVHKTTYCDATSMTLNIHYRARYIMAFTLTETYRDKQAISNSLSNLVYTVMHSLPAIVAFVSSSSSLSFSSRSFWISRWCCLWMSSITFWCVSSIAVNPRSHVACIPHKTPNNLYSSRAMPTMVFTYLNMYLCDERWKKAQRSERKAAWSIGVN